MEGQTELAKPRDIQEGMASGTRLEKIVHQHLRGQNPTWRKNARKLIIF
jgi:hypothetical protein